MSEAEPAPVSDEEPAAMAVEEVSVLANTMAEPSHCPKVFIRSRDERFGKKAVDFFGSLTGAIEFAIAKGLPCSAPEEDPVAYLSRLHRTYRLPYNETILWNQAQVDGHAKIEEIYAKADTIGVDCEDDALHALDDNLKTNADYVIGMMKSWVAVEDDENNGPAGACPLLVSDLRTNQVFLLELCKIWGIAYTFEHAADEELVADKDFILSALNTAKLDGNRDDPDTTLEHISEALQEDEDITAFIDEWRQSNHQQAVMALSASADLPNIHKKPSTEDDHPIKKAH